MVRALPIRGTKEKVEHQLKKFTIQKSLMIVKLKGIGLSLVDFNPRELCYFSIEGLVFLSESNLYKYGNREKSFTKMEVSMRNLQIDDCLNNAVPIVLGTKIPFRNIERNFKEEIGEQK